MHRNVVAMIVFNALRGATVGGFLALLPIYMASLGYGMDLIGGAIAAASLALSLLLPSVGYLIEVLGSRVMVAFSGVILALAPLLPVYTSLLHLLALSYGLLLASFFMGQPARMTFLARSVRGERLGSVIGVVSSAMSASRLVGPTLAGFAAEILGYREAFLILAALAAAGLAAFTALSVDPEGEVRGPRGSLLEAYARALKPSRGFTVILGFVALDRISWSLWLPMLSAFLYLRGLSEAEVGVLMSLMGVSRTVGLPIAGRITDAVGAWIGIAASEGLGVLGVLALALPSSMPTLIAAVALLGFSIALWIPAYNTLIARIAGGRLGEAYSVANSVRSLAGAPAPYIGGVIYEALAPIAPFIASALLMALASGIAATAIRGVESRCAVVPGGRVVEEPPVR